MTNVSNVITVNFSKPQQLTGQEKVNLRDIWEQLGKPKQFADWAKQVTKRLKDGTDYSSFHHVVKREVGATTLVEYWVTVDAAKLIAMLTNNVEGDKVRTYFIECEKLVYANGLAAQISAVPNIMDPDFIIGLATKLKEETARADEAERTKAHISDRKTASAMGTASAAVRKLKVVETMVKDLEVQQGLSGMYRTTIAWEKVYPALKGLTGVGNRLSAAGKKLGLPSQETTTASQYGGFLKAHHEDAVKALLGI